MRVMAQMAMVMNLDKCIGCHTCSVTCKQAWTNRAGTEYVWFNNVETRPGQGYPRRYADQERWRGGWVRNRRDGTVEALFAGDPQAVHTMIDACRRGPPGARVAEVAEREGREDELQDGARFLVLGTL